MKKHLLSILSLFITLVINAQVYTPFGNIQSTINNTRNIHIGSNNPEHKLDVQGHIRINTYSPHSSIILGKKTNTNIFSDDSIDKYYGGGMFFRVDNETIAHKYIDALLILENGNVGIGHKPQSKLDVAGGINIQSGLPIQINGSDISHGLKYKRFNSDESLLDGPLLYGWSGGALGVKKDNQETNILTWNDRGNVGIGTNNPNYKLSVQGHSFSTAHTIQSWSPTIYLKRDTDEDGYTQGIQTQLLNGDNNWFFGNLHADNWIVAKGDYTGSLFKISSSGNASLQGKLEAKEIKVTTTPTADFVFSDNYNLPTLEAVEKHIKEKRHLPEIASAKEMEKEGVNIGEFQIKLLQKIEELTLYSIEQNKKIKELEDKIEKMVNE